MMYFRDNQRHHLPHIHVRYQGEEVAISLEDGSLLEGTLPPRQLKMIQVWIDLHQDETQLGLGGQWRGAVSHRSSAMRVP